MTPSQILTAREMLSEGKSLVQAAECLGMLAREVDVGLWEYARVSSEDLMQMSPRKRWRPDFD